jgi:hypothetical protein
MAKGKKKKRSYKKRYKKVKKTVNKARSKTLRIVKALVLEAPLIGWTVEGVTQANGIQDNVVQGSCRLLAGTTGVLYGGGGRVTWQPQYLMLGWGGPVVYKAITFGANMIPGEKVNPFTNLSRLTG